MSVKPVFTGPYQILASPSGRFRVETSPQVEKMKNVLYMFFNIETGESYTGRTSDLKKRLSKHESAMNRDSISHPLYQAIRENPDHIYFSVVYQVDQDCKNAIVNQLLDELEKETILEAGENTYNRNLGGGGGYPAEPIDSQESESLEDSIDIFSDPKFYPIHSSDDGLKVDWTPNGKKSKGVLYAIIDTETNQTYFGKTEQELGRRLAGHIHFANHPEKERGQNPLAKALRKNPDRFVVAILAEVKEEEINRVAARALTNLEKTFIQQNRENSFNRNGGGGGPSAAKRLRFENFESDDDLKTNI